MAAERRWERTRGASAARRWWIVAASAVVVCLAGVAAGVARSARTPHDAAPATAGRTTALRTTSPPTVGLPDAGAPSDRGVLPPVPARVDYQLGGPYDPDPSVGIVVRDRTAPPVPGIYSICYVNAYQTQPDEADLWSGAAADLVLRDAAGSPVVDEAWDELFLDTATPAQRQRLAEIVGAWIDGCAAAGYQAVELDNLDSWTRSDGRLTAADNLAYAALLIARAHSSGLAVAQKNAPELGGQGRATGFDFAVAEDCQVWSECDAYTEVYDSVIEVEYTDAGFAAACSQRGTSVSVQRRDLALAPRGDRAHVARWC